MVKNSSFLLTPPYLFLYPPTKGTFWIQYYGTVPTNSKFTFFKLTPLYNPELTSQHEQRYYQSKY
jgi:hypothetical protein